MADENKPAEGKPAKGNRMAQEAEQERQEQLKARTYMLTDKQWEDASGDEFGGKADILILEVGEVAGPLVYVGHQAMTTDLGDTTVHLATNKEGETLRLPIQATFQRAVDQAGLNRGDTFMVKRFEDQDKKKGKGAGKPMAIYGIKVTNRVPAPPAAAS